jgi:xylan 1,4-beta-xylosidase
MFGMMDGQRVSLKTNNALTAGDIIANGVRGVNDINGLASKGQNSICIMVWNYHDDDIKGASSKIKLTVDGIAKPQILLHHYRVDDQYSNSFEEWKVMGKPQHVTEEQYRTLEKAGQLHTIESPGWLDIENGECVIEFSLPRQAVSLLRLTW